jgi:hypothetical protein
MLPPSWLSRRGRAGEFTPLWGTPALKFLEKMTSEYFRPCYGLFITSVFYNFELRLQKILEENGVHTPWQEKFPDQYERFKKLKNEPDENLRAALAEILTKALINGSVEIRKAIE